MPTTNTAPSFRPANSGTGEILIDFSNTNDYANSLALQTDGKILVAGTSSADFGLIRLNGDGTLDTTFSSDGKATFDINSGVDEGRSVTVQADGKILVAGFSQDSSGDYNSADFSVIRLNADGSRDETFGGFSYNNGYNYNITKGAATFDVGSSSYRDIGSSVTLQNDGKILISGAGWDDSGGYIGVIRLNKDGTLDTTFSGDGRVTISGNLNSPEAYVTVQSDGKILIAGSTQENNINPDYKIIRLNADGTLDKTFGTDGVFISDIQYDDYVHGITVQGDGKLLVAGESFGDMSLIRLNTNGSLDTTFGLYGNGKAVFDISGGGYDTGRSVTVQADGKILVAGFSTTSGDYDFSVIRLNTNGTPDTTFGNNHNGTATFNIWGVDEAYSVSVQTDGKILIAGSSGGNNGGNDFSVIRLNGDGTLDTSFDNHGSSLGGTFNYTEGAPAIALDTTVKVYDAELAALNGGQGNYSGASITLSHDGGASSQDLFSGLGALSLSGGNAVLSGITVGTVSNTSGVLVITFNDSATQTRVDETLSSLGYTNTSDAPPASEQINWVFSDGSSTDTRAVTGSIIVNITGVNDAPTGAVTITGTAAQGLTLTADTSTLADADGLGSLSYQWLHAGIAITDATASTYKLVQADTGSDVSVQVSYTDGGATKEIITSSIVVPYVSTQPSAGDDQLTGTSGNDTLDGGAGADTMTGGDGSDTYYVDNAGDVVIETNAVLSSGGTDLVYSSLSTYTLGANVENGVINTANTASLTGNSLDNRLFSGAGNNVLDGDLGSDTVDYQYATAGVTVSLATTAAQVTGGSGSDTLLNIENLSGSSYADTLTGNADSNILNGGAGADTMTGGDGNDTYYVDNAGDVVIETNAVASTGGTDLVYSYLSAYTLGANIENGRILSSGTASLTGNSLANLLYAGAGNNVLDGAGGTDTVSYQYATAGVTVSLATTAAQVTGGSGSDTLLNIERLTGSNYADTLTGNAGNNYLIGGTGNDTLNGGAGDDVLVGGLGADNLTGGTGADKFIFNSLAEMGSTSTTWDTITDFKTSEGDKIDLQGLDANTALAGHQAFTFIGTVSTFTGDATGQLRFDAATHILYGSTNADTAAEFAIVLTGVDSLASTDLVL
jgi:uncharacterized delta-60 repeat protein